MDFEYSCNMETEYSFSLSSEVNLRALTAEELEEMRPTLPPGKKLKKGRNYITRKSNKKKPYWNVYMEYLVGDQLHVECKFCDSTYSYNGNKKNVRNHAANCIHNPENKSQDDQDELMFESGVSDSSEEDGEVKSKSQYGVVNLTELRQAIVEMVILEGCSFRFAQSPGFVRVMEVACPRYPCQSHFSVARDTLELYKSEKMKLKGVFRDSCQRVSISIEKWTSNQELNYMCITAHFIDSEWKLQKRILNFCPITSHIGEDIGKGIEECLESWGIDAKLFTVTIDNTGPNSATCAYLEKMIERSGGISKGRYVHIRCFAHIIKLIVWDGIRDEQTSINRIRTAVKFIRNCPARSKRLKYFGEKLDIDTKALLYQDFPTRWDSTYFMLDAACRLRHAIDGIDLPPSDKPDEQAPNDDDWTKVGKLVVFLKRFYSLTQNTSGSLYSTCSVGLDQVYVTLIELNKWEENGDEKMKSMAIVMREKYEMYWGDLGKMNMMMYMAVILHPLLKFEIVEMALEDIFKAEKAKALARDVKKYAYELFDEYKSMYSQSCANQVGEDGNESYYVKMIKEINRKRAASGNVRSEFDRYLIQELGDAEQDLDALAWWGLNADRYPIVSRMARDILAIPLSTVSSESAFTEGGRQVGQFRSSLNPLTLQALICTQDWIRARKRTKICDMEDDLKDLEELEEIEEEMKNVTLDKDDNVIYIAEP